MSILVLVKHGSPVLDPDVPAREWVLSPRGEAEAARLADRLREHLPFRLVSSSEPKALRTAEIVASALSTQTRRVADLGEIDRPAMPIMTRDMHREVNAGIFSHPDQAVIGTESAQAALRRFSAGIEAQLEHSPAENLVAVTHGTVISLFVAAHNPIDAFTFWSRLECASFVTVEVPSFRMLRGVPLQRSSTAYVPTS
jgi:broad specificity phosphatase PhoE